MSWATVQRDRLADGTAVIVKRTTYDAHLEAEGLDALRAAGAPTPVVHHVDDHRLVMDEVTGPPRWDELGRALATAHRTTAAGFGWHRDNVIGSLPQVNEPDPHWPTFYIEHRIQPFLGDVPTDIAHRLERAAAGPLLDLLDHDAPPSLVHGDLWSGNVVDGRWLIDPAVCHSDRELDLAFSTVFGSLPAAFYRSYQEEWPLDPGWEERRPALQLYHLLAHCRLFGGGYPAMVDGRLRHYGW